MLKKHFIILLSLVLALTVAIGVYAQDAEAFDETDKGYIVQPITAGELVDNGDETFTFTINELPAFVTALVDNGEEGGLGSGNYRMNDLINNFYDISEGTPSIEVPVRLQTDTAVINGVVSAPVLSEDQTNVVFTFVFVDGLNLENGKDLKAGDLPTTLEDVSLIYVLDSVTLNAISANAVANLDDGRLGSATSQCMNCGK
jgi:hypothetical protein